MIAEKPSGYVLGHTQLSASRVVLTTFTRESGKRQGVFQFRGKQSRVCLTPMTYISYEARSREHQELEKIGDLTVEHHFYDFASNYLGLSLLQHMAFLVNTSQPDRHPDERVFRLMTHCLEICDDNANSVQTALTVLYFESWLLHLCGVLPRVRASGLQAGAIDEGADFRLISRLQTPLMQRVFGSKAKDLCENPPPGTELAGPFDTLGVLWEQFLARKLPTRTVLLQLLGYGSNRRI